jgi:hypothetical protein
MKVKAYAAHSGRVSYRWRTCSLVGNDLDALDVASGLEDLTQHVLSDSGVQSTNIQRALVRLRGSATRNVARLAAGRGHGVGAHGRADGGRDRVVVLRDDDRGERRGRHVLLWLALVSVVARSASRRRRGKRSPRVLLVGHSVARQSAHESNRTKSTGRFFNLN